jgi:hypothetical protein
MNGKSDNFVRLSLFVVVLLLTAQVCIQFFYPVGRYVQFPMEDRKFVLLDTRTGSVYAYDLEKKTVVEINLVELARKQKRELKP